jgi:hypothetical protein|tara:strand:+ start:2047 stop:2424 length:378 start_codon:yes stop_codon:yes gene_type:complete
MTKRQLNTKLKSKLLMPNKTSGNYEYLKDFKIKVVRARTVPYKVWVDRKEITLTKTLTTIKIEGQVKCTGGRYVPVEQYGPRHIRNYLRRANNGIVGAVSSWVKLWGFDNDVELERIDLVKKINA